MDDSKSIMHALGGLVALIVVTMVVVFTAYHLLDKHLQRMVQAAQLQVASSSLDRELTDANRYFMFASEDIFGSQRTIVVDAFVADFSVRIRRIEELNIRVKQSSQRAEMVHGDQLSDQLEALMSSWRRVMDNLYDHQAEAMIELMSTTDPLSFNLLSSTVPAFLDEATSMQASSTTQYERIRVLSISMIVLVFLGAYVTALILISHIMGILRDKRDLADSLRTAMLSAQDANEAKSRFLSNMSHELRTPMNGVIGMANVLSAQRLPPDHRNMVNVLKTSADAALTLINDILDFEAIEAGKVSLEHRRFDLRAVADRIEYLAMAQLMEKPITFHVHLAEDVPSWVNGDEDRLTQILTNLVTNAIKFTEMGQVGLHISWEGNTGVRFKVQDTGIGIPADKIDILFDSFQQGDDSIRRRYGGTGLGLSITRSLVHMMHGTIRVESEPGKGSVFIVTIPLPEFKQEMQEEVQEVAFRPAFGAIDENLTLLCVDDNPINIEVARYLLRDSGVEFLSAESGNEALDIMRGHAVDVVLLDCHMQGMDGFETSLRIREDHPRAVVLALTADATLITQKRCEESGMQGFITKPFTPASLIEGIRVVLDRAADQGEVTASGVSSRRA